jgi:ribosomal protein S18 acetylase RimI-like enzyme
MTIRRLLPADAATYRTLMLEAYEMHPEAFTSSPAERASLPLGWWEARLDDAVGAPDAVWGAFEAGQLAGVAGLSRGVREKVTHKATLFGMYVRPAHRSRGVGDSLIRVLMAYAASKPELKVVQLTVTEGNASARSLYERHGFVEFGVEPYAVAVSGRFVTKVHMSRLVGRDLNP